MATNYPTVFCHGFMGWGENDGIYKYVPYWGVFQKKNILKHLRDEGYECYAPSLGPFNSAWDRACELWAIIMGGTVDYGKVHSEKYGHARFGRTYPGLINDWGTPGPHEKINIVGHSFGGPTVLAFADLLANGSEEERKGTPAEELSPFFLPDKKQKLHCASTLTGVLNGTTFASWLRRPGVVIVGEACLLLVSITGNSKLTRYYDFYMDHWDMMENQYERKENYLRGPFAIRKQINNYHRNFFDAIGHEMQLECMQEICKKMGPPAKETYYFAHSGDRTHYDEKRGYRMINKDANFISKVPAILCSRWGSDYLAKNYHWNLAEWTYHDGFVNVPGQKAPFCFESIDATSFNDAFRPGIWYNLPTRENCDHLTWIGLGETAEDTFKFFDDLLKRYAELA
ncbi:MAG: hypothetical protein IK036_01195 [Clostridia bacterium]|nr:hypothetical protein [Clostridia bacterium]MBR5991350.1 hypothetical protein [Clostridia bacterium]